MPSSSFSPDWANAALLTINVQQDFALPGTPAEIPGTAESVSAMQRLAEEPSPGLLLSNTYGDLGANTIVVCECNFPNCPRPTIYEASDREPRITFLTDVIPGVYERGLREPEDIGVKLMSVGELSEKLVIEPSNA